MHMRVSEFRVLPPPLQRRHGILSFWPSTQAAVSARHGVNRLLAVRRGLARETSRSCSRGLGLRAQWMMHGSGLWDATEMGGETSGVHVAAAAAGMWWPDVSMQLIP